MKNEYEDDKDRIELKFYPIMVLKPFSNMKPGAYTGKSYSARNMDEISDAPIKVPLINISSRCKI
jgi:hypothetical protein